MSRTFQTLGSINDPTAPYFDGVHHRRESSAKPKEIKPLLTREPLPHVNDREKKQSLPPKKRKRVLPTKPALTFNPRSNSIPSGRQDPPASSPLFTGPSASESSISSFDDPPPSLSDHEIHDQVYDGYDAHKRPRIFGQCSSAEYLTPSNPATPCTDPNESSSVPPEFYDSPVSYTSSSSPAPSDQSPCAPEFAVQVIDYPRQVQGSLPMYPYGDHAYLQQPAIHQDLYSGYAMDPCQDRPGQSYPVQYFDTAYVRGVPHTIPTHPDNNGSPYPPHRY